MWSLLSIVIGIVFVMLLFSLLATSLMELIAAVLGFRGKHLTDAIGLMIGDARQAFVDHPYFQQLAIGARLNKKRVALPSYISPGTFSSIMTDLLHQQPGEDIRERIETMPDNETKKVLIFLYEQTSGEVDELKQKMEEWYSEIMDRASGAYIRKTRSWLMGIGLALAIVFNVDPIHIYKTLSLNAALSEHIANMATTYVQTQAPPPDPSAAPDFYAARQKIGSLINNNIDAISSPLGLGWDHVQPEDTTDFRWWLYKAIGWLVTALAISLGASFWFNALKQLVNLRASSAPSAPTSAGPPPSSGSGSILTRAGAESAIRSAKPPKKETEDKSRS